MTTVKAYLIAGGIFHDIDFAREELLKLLGEHNHIRVEIAEDYSDTDAILQSDFLITYTCNVVPTLEQQQCLKDYIHSGKRWVALHGTNTILQILENGIVGTRNTAPVFTDILGSEFIGHPPIKTFTVTPTEHTHDLTKEIKPFETRDELYLLNFSNDITVLLETEYAGKAGDFFENDTNHPNQKWPVLYLQQLGQGSILYLTLGHCNGHDNNPLQDYVPLIERCSWELPVFYQLIRRSICWAIKQPIK